MPDNLQKIRAEQKMSQMELSKKSGVSRAIISGLESGRIKTTTTGTLQRLANALGVGIENFFTQKV